MEFTRRRLCSAGATLGLVGIGGCLGGSSGEEDADGAEPTTFDGWELRGTPPVGSVVQYHDPTCGCCGEYVDYLEATGIEVAVEETDDLGAVKDELSIPGDARSCHTVEVGDYLVEGHVPIEAIDALLEEEPDVLGVAAPGMPQHSPGMGPPGDEPLAIYAFDEAGDVYEYVEV